MSSGIAPNPFPPGGFMLSFRHRRSWRGRVAVLELSVITGKLAQMGLEKGFAALSRSETAIRFLRTTGGER